MGIPEQKPIRRDRPCRIALALPKSPSKSPLDCWLQEFQERYHASNAPRCGVSAVVALAGQIDLADFHNIRMVQPAHSPDCQPDYAFGNLAPKSDIADLLLAADTADTVLEVSIQTDVGDQLSLPLAADTASSP